MNPLNLIPVQYQLAARLVALLVLAAACFAGGWTINGWHLAAEVAEVEVAHSLMVTKATQQALAQLKAVTAERDQKAAALAAIDGTHQKQLSRLQHENDSLRADVGVGARVVRIRATCPAAGGTSGVPEAAAGGRVDPGAGAVLAPEDGQAVLDLRGSAGRVDTKLAACQAALGCLTGQGACPSGARE